MVNLPFDVHEYLARYCHASTWHSCALVSSQWAPIFQKEIFSELVLADSFRLPALLDVFDTSPHLILYVRSLLIHSFWIIHNNQHTPLILQHLTEKNVRILTIDIGRPISKPWCGFSPSVTAAILTFVQSSSFRELGLTEIDEIPPSLLIQSPNMQHLSTSRCSFLHLTEEDMLAPLQVRLDSLSICSKTLAVLTPAMVHILLAQRTIRKLAYHIMDEKAASPFRIIEYPPRLCYLSISVGPVWSSEIQNNPFVFDLSLLPELTTLVLFVSGRKLGIRSNQLEDIYCSLATLRFARSQKINLSIICRTGYVDVSGYQRISALLATPLWQETLGSLELQVSPWSDVGD